MTLQRFLHRPMPAVLCCLFIAVPFLVAEFPPITDLPQQAAQIRLFLETLRNPEDAPYRIQWFTPYSLSYLALGASWALFGPERAGRMAMLGIALLWIVAIHLTARHRGRSAAAATLAGLFVLNHIMYWGFYSFAIGWPAFLLWFHAAETSYGRKASIRDAALLLSTGLLLYVSHVLWFIAGIGWLLVSGLLLHRDLRAAAVRIGYLVPLIAAVAMWYPMFSESTMSTPALWVSTPFSRLTLSWLSDAALGGIRGPAVPVVFCAAWVWIAVGIAQHVSAVRVRRGRADSAENHESSMDWNLFAAACMFFGMALILPDKFMNTIRFGERWMPAAMILLVLAAPAPMFRPVLRRAVAAVAVAGLCTVIALTWLSFQKKDLSGLQDALNALPEKPSVLGLSFIQHSEFVTGYPFIQMFAYSQLLKGGTLNFSFAEFSPCLVVYKTQFIPPWTGSLEWYPRRVRSTDLDYFDFALINAVEKEHRFWATQPRLTPVTSDGRWRLYRISPGNDSFERPAGTRD
ncbi:MAG: hypothetical protein RDU20_02800 [Desulfomonilaceae bacterium]|nr:hypothetical protein [Desulfomonilaceae bacterium]